MTDIVRLAPHDPIPSEPDHYVLVLHRFAEDDPRATETMILLNGKRPERTHPRRPDGTPMTLHEAIDAAVRVAESESLDRVLVIDRTSGEREQDILSHHGDHAIHNEQLIDSDMEDGERGPDVRGGSE